jgi:NADP-dependent 3-hydroxy acid dehydrogenase YdfG
MDKTAFVTGASAGIGEATARALLAAGYRVFAGARRLDRMAGLAAAGATLIKLDLTDDASIVAAVNTIKNAAGRIDVLVNNPATAPTARWKTCRSTKGGGSSRSMCSGWRGSANWFCR